MRKVLEVLGLGFVSLARVSLASLCGTLVSLSPLLNNGLLNLASTCSNILELLSQDASISQEKKRGGNFVLLDQYTYF